MDEVIKKLGEHDKRFDQLDKQFDLLAQRSVEHEGRLDRLDQKLEQMATKEDISNVMNTLDKIVGFMEKKDEEVTLLAHGMGTAENRIEVLKKDVSQMKPLLGFNLDAMAKKMFTPASVHARWLKKHQGVLRQYQEQQKDIAYAKRVKKGKRLKHGDYS